MPNEVEIFSSPSYAYVSDNEIADLGNAIRNSEKTAEFTQKVASDAEGINRVNSLIAEKGEQAWNDATLPDGSAIRYAQAGDTSVFAIPRVLSETQKIDIGGDTTKHFLEVEIIYKTPSSAYGNSFTFRTEQLLLSIPALTLLTKLLSSGFQASAQRLATAAIAGEMEGAVASEGYLVKTFKWAGGKTRLAGAFRTGVASAILYGVYEGWNAWISRHYSHSMLIYNATDLALDVSVRYLHNISQNDKTASDNHVLGPVVRPGSSTIVSGLPIVQNSTRMSMASLSFYDDGTFLSGIGDYVQLKPVNSSPFTNLNATTYIPRREDNSMNLWFNETSEDYEMLYDKYEGKNKKTRVESENGSFKAIHTMNKLSGAENDAYKTILVLVDTASFTGAEKLLS